MKALPPSLSESPLQPEDFTVPAFIKTVSGSHRLQSEIADESSLRRFQHAALLGLGARVLEKLGVIHARRAGRHARETAEAEIHFVRERFRRLKISVGDGTHQRDAPARTVSLQLCGVVSRARRQAKPAVHALLHHGVIEVF